MKILMVCLGNICRSPLAEGILKEKVKELAVEVDSAGTGAWHSGELPDQRSIAIAAEHGIDLTNQRARIFIPEDLDLFDAIYVMDQDNYKQVCKWATNDTQLNKVHLILDVFYPEQSKEVPDPYYGGADGFKNVYNLLDAACDIIAQQLKQTLQ